MRGISGRQWLLAIGSGLLQALIFPSPSVFVLSWIALAPLILAIVAPDLNSQRLIDPQGSFVSGPSARHGFFLGYASGVVWYAATCYWIFHVMHIYGGLPTLAAAGVLLLFCLYLGLYHGAFGTLLALAVRLPGNSLRKALLLTPFLWVAIELARARITGFPWNLLGTAQVDNIPLTRMATFTGVYGLSFIVALVNAGIVASFLSPSRQRPRLLSVAFAIAVMLQLGVLARPRALPAPETARLVQANVPLDAPWTPGLFTETLSDLERLSAGPAGAQRDGKLRLIIWPETPAPFFDNDDNFRGKVSWLAQKHNSFLITGLVGSDKNGRAGATSELANRAVLVAPDGRWVARYDKIHLVPFGEYVPFQSVLSFANKLTRDVGNFRPGSERTPFDAGGNKLGTFICYEEIFPDEVRQFAANGAQVFINISNDGWYGEHGAPGQLLNMARMRAIENRRWLLRDTNTGITVSVDPLGRIVARAPANRRTAMEASYRLISNTTFYTRHGDWLGWGCAIISVVALFTRLRFRFIRF